jgi:hypothetical protein
MKIIVQQLVAHIAFIWFLDIDHSRGGAGAELGLLILSRERAQRLSNEQMHIKLQAPMIPGYSNVH